MSVTCWHEGGPRTALLGAGGCSSGAERARVPPALQRHLEVIQNIGMSRIDEVEYEAPLADGTGTAKVKIVPLQFLKAQGTYKEHSFHLAENEETALPV